MQSLDVKVVWKGVLSQDVITTAKIPVVSTSPAPVAVFTNPASGGRKGNPLPEALAIVNIGHGAQLHHVARVAHPVRGGDAGWKATPLFGGRRAEEVAAGVADAGTADAAVYGLFLEDKKLYWTSLGDNGATWSTPKEVNGPAMTKLRAAYSPFGRLVVYGADAAGNLVTAYQETQGGGFKSTVCDMYLDTGSRGKKALSSGDFHLCMTDEKTWRIVANVDQQAYLISGDLGARERSSCGRAPGFDEKLKQVALGYWSDTQKTVIFLLVGGDDGLHAWSQSQAAGARVQKIPHSSVAQAAGHVAEDGSLHVYAVDSRERLWVLHQSDRKPWNDDGTPNWTRFLPLDQGVVKVAGDMNPRAEPVLFGLAAGDYSLRLHTLDARTRRWKSHKVLQPSTTAFEVAVPH